MWLFQPPHSRLTPSPHQCALTSHFTLRIFSRDHLLLHTSVLSPRTSTCALSRALTPACSCTSTRPHRSPPLYASPHNCDICASSPSSLSVRNSSFHSFPPSSPFGETAKLNPFCKSAKRSNLRSTAAPLLKSKKWVCTEFASLLSRTTDVPRRR